MENLLINAHVASILSIAGVIAGRKYIGVAGVTRISLKLLKMKQLTSQCTKSRLLKKTDLKIVCARGAGVMMCTPLLRLILS
jgi:hypothetical protein